MIEAHNVARATFLPITLEGCYTEICNDLAVVLSSVASVQDLVSGLAFSLLLFVDISIVFNMEVVMETNLFTVFKAVKSECASLWGLKRRADSARYT